MDEQEGGAEGRKRCREREREEGVWEIRELLPSCYANKGAGHIWVKIQKTKNISAICLKKRVLISLLTHTFWGLLLGSSVFIACSILGYSNYSWVAIIPSCEKL